MLHTDDSVREFFIVKQLKIRSHNFLVLLPLSPLMLELFPLTVYIIAFVFSLLPFSNLVSMYFVLSFGQTSIKMRNNRYVIAPNQKSSERTNKVCIICLFALSSYVSCKALLIIGLCGIKTDAKTLYRSTYLKRVLIRKHI